MHIRYTAWRIAGAAGLALFASAMASAAENTLGKNEYEARCAMCHGAA